MKNTSRIAMLALKGLALLVVAVALVSIAPERRAEAQIGDLTGVYCIDLYTDRGDLLNDKGTSHDSEDGIGSGPHIGEPETKILTRIELSSEPGFDWDLTSVSYRGPGGFVVTEPPSDAPCASKGDNNTLNVDPILIDVRDRPTNSAVEGTKASQKVLEWDICSFESDLGAWVNTHWNVEIGASPPYFGELLVDLGGDDSVCDSQATGSAQHLVIEMYKRVATLGPPGGGADDWDGDGVSDWNELAEEPPAGFCDPFNDPPCDVVGGVAEAPALTGAPAQAGDSTGDGGVGVLWAIGIALAAGAAGTVAAVWYLRRRRADG